MGSWRLIPFLLIALGVPSASVAQSARLGPESKQFEALVGTWRLEGSVRAIPETGAKDSGPVSYRHVNVLVNDGAILQVHRTGTGPSGPVEELWMFTYNPVTKTYRMDGSTARGVMRNFIVTIKGSTWTFAGTNTTVAGVVTRERFTIVYAPDMASATVRSEHSKDGKSWFERLTGTYSRLAP